MNLFILILGTLTTWFLLKIFFKILGKLAISFFLKIRTLKISPKKILIILIGAFIYLGISYIINLLKSPTEKLDLRLPNRIESFANEELSSFVKNRDEIANTVLKMIEKRNKHLKDVNSMKYEKAKEILQEEVQILDSKIDTIRYKAVSINASIEELYAIKQITDENTFDEKIHTILKRSEDLKQEASAMASDMKKTF